MDAGFVAESSHELHVVGVIKEPGSASSLLGTSPKKIGTGAGALGQSEPMIRMKNMRSMQIRRLNVDGLIVPFVSGWACCHILNASTCYRPISTAPPRAGSCSMRKSVKSRRSVSTSLTVFGRCDDRWCPDVYAPRRFELSPRARPFSTLKHRR